MQENLMYNFKKTKTMHPKVERFLQNAKEEKLKERQKRLIELGLYDEVEVDGKNGYDCHYYKWDEDLKMTTTKYFNKVDIEISDDEYFEIIKYTNRQKNTTKSTCPPKQTTEDIGEDKLVKVSQIFLKISITLIIISILIGGFSSLYTYDWTLYGFIIFLLMAGCATVGIISLFCLYWAIRIFCNISKKTTSINMQLHELSQK